MDFLFWGSLKIKKVKVKPMFLLTMLTFPMWLGGNDHKNRLTRWVQQRDTSLSVWPFIQDLKVVQSIGFVFFVHCPSAVVKKKVTCIMMLISVNSKGLGLDFTLKYILFSCCQWNKCLLRYPLCADDGKIVVPKNSLTTHNLCLHKCSFRQVDHLKGQIKI